MKSLSFQELKSLAQWLNRELSGAQLQEIWTYDQGLILQFYRHQEFFLWIDGRPNAPMICLLEQRPPLTKKQKPISPFLNSNAKNMRWLECEVDPTRGRILDIELKNSEQSCFLQIQLIPKAFNIIAKTADKKISWEKPRDLPTSQTPDSFPIQEDIDWYQKGREHLQLLLQPKSEGKNQKQDPRPRAIEKKEKALVELKKTLELDLASEWQTFGEHLKTQENIPDEWLKLYKKQLSRAENRENAFQQAKLLKKKKVGTLQRIAILENEILQLKQDLQETPFESLEMSKPSLGQKMMQKSSSKGRRLQLSEQIDAVMGKTAKDNLAILRAAQPTDLWLHLKDEPSAHVIIAKPKNMEVPPKLIQQAAEWLMSEMFSKKKERLQGRYEVIVVECRHVKPIKGDKWGRVTHHHSRTFGFIFGHASK